MSKRHYTPHGSGYWVGEDGLAYGKCLGCGTFSIGSGIGLAERRYSCKRCVVTKGDK